MKKGLSVFFLLVFPVKSIEKQPQEPNPQYPWGLAVFLVLIVSVFVIHNQTDFFQLDEDGRPKLAPWRKAKLEKELEELENAEQYALVAMRDGYYSCFNCGQKTTIFLFKGEIWKYGVTRKGEKERYGEWHIDQGLLYVIQYEGPLLECLRQEKMKIYNYGVLPENQKRTPPLIRPPGNKRDT